MAEANYDFEGWMGTDKHSVDGKMKWGKFEPKAFEDNDVDIRISHSGICGSDLHTLRSGWGPTPYPCCVGHEIVGYAVKVGKKAEGGIKVGDRVGVGAQSDSCLSRGLKGGEKCPECSNNMEQYCSTKVVNTYGSTHFNGDKSYGGYALYNRSPSHFVVKIPEAVPSADAAPMLCAGVTTYSPLKHYGCAPGKTVGIVGVGGLGHFGVLWAKALGADKVVAISRKASKKDEALKLGADSYIATDDDKDWAKANAASLDLILCTVSSSKMPLNDYMSLLRTDGSFVQVGVPEDGGLQVPAGSLIMGRKTMGGSCIGSPADIREMLQLAADKKVKPWIQERPMKDANQAIVDMADGKARFRYVLVNEQHL